MTGPGGVANNTDLKRDYWYRKSASVMESFRGFQNVRIAWHYRVCGIEPTVRQGLGLNHLPVVITDACGSKTEELKHRSLVTLDESGEVFMASIIDFVELLDVL